MNNEDSFCQNPAHNPNLPPSIGRPPRLGPMDPRITRPARSACCLLAAGALAACSGTPASSSPTTPGLPPITVHTELPAPGDRPAPPPGSVTESSLPTAEELGTALGGTWRVVSTDTASTNTPVSECQRSKFESLGGPGLQIRTYAGPNQASATVVALSFPDGPSAQRGRDTLTEWITTCPQAYGTAASITVPPTPVAMGADHGQISQVSWREPRPRVETQALILTNDRLAFLAVRATAGNNRDSAERAMEPVSRALHR